MAKKKKRKKYRLNARFYCWVLGLCLVITCIINIKATLETNSIPNFHGWTAEDVMKYDESHENISIIYELAYSYDVLQNCVMEQSIKPRTPIGTDPLILTIQVSKGYPLMEDFTGKSLNDLKEFADKYELKVEASAGEGTIEIQSILVGEPLIKGMTVKVTVK